jgi:RimJ/RimL family protein N-acetyltransferase
MIVSWVPDAQALYLFAGHRLSWPLTVDQLVEGEQDPERTAWVVVSASLDAIGQFELTTRERHSHLGRVLLDPTVRGRGLAHELVRLAVARASALGATSVGLRVAAGNRPAVRTYERAGFVMTEGQASSGSRAMTLDLAARVR